MLSNDYFADLYIHLLVGLLGASLPLQVGRKRVKGRQRGIVEKPILITAQQLQAIMPAASKQRIARFFGPLNATMEEFAITTTARQAAFLAQLGHESGSLRYVEEIASGKAYDGREDLGNASPAAIELAAESDTTPGPFYKGRGLIQITGYYNYRDCSKAMLGNSSLLISPDLLQSDDLACRSAGWFWNSRKLNSFADEGQFETITRKINGGLNGQADRLAFYNRALAVLSMQPTGDEWQPDPTAVIQEPKPALSLVSRMMVMPSFLSALKSGEELVNAAKVKNIQGVVSALGGLVIYIAMIARAYGYQIPITDDQLQQFVVLGSSLLLNAWATFATSKRVGINVPTSTGGDDPGVAEPTADRPAPGGWAKDMGIGS